MEMLISGRSWEHNSPGRVPDTPRGLWAYNFHLSFRQVGQVQSQNWSKPVGEVVL